MKTISDISQMLADRAEATAVELLPNGKRAGKEWQAGSVDGEKGASLNVCIAGSKAGVWSDFATGERGDLMDLWATVRGVDLGEALQQAASWLGVEMPKFAGKREQSYQPPAVPKTARVAGASDPAMNYLRDVRQIPQAVIEAYRVQGTATSVLFPFYHGDDLKMMKALRIARIDGKKDIRPTSGEQMHCLFGWQAVSDKARNITICEGEIDAMSLYACGFTALSVPFGGGAGGKHQWIENEYDRLARFDTIYLCFDNDEAGKTATADIARRLGEHRCRVVKLPLKDANECLLAGQLDLVNRGFLAAQSFDPQELRSASEFYDEIHAKFYPDGGVEAGLHLPFFDSEKLVLRPAELSIWNGVNGHGKSQAVGQIVLEAMRDGSRCCVASMEFKPEMLLWRITTQAAGLNGDSPPSPEFIREITNWYQRRLWMFGVVGSANWERLLEVFQYAAKRYGCNIFVVDSLLKCGIDEDDYNGQKRFVEALCDFKNTHDCHVLLVTHSRKGDGEFKPTGKMDVRGSGTITDLCDTLVNVWRNKPKEKEINSSDAEIRDKAADKPDSIWSVQKQRNGNGWEGGRGLWFHPPSMQFLRGQHAKPFQYVGYSSQQSEQYA